MRRQPVLPSNFRWSLLGNRLRIAREAKDLTGKDVELHLRTFVAESPTYQERPGAPQLTARGTTESTVYRQEAGQSKVKDEILGIYAELYRPDSEADANGDAWRKEVENWHLLANLARVKGTWVGAGSQIGPSYRDFVEVEGIADELRTWQPQVIPGLLQTTAYSAAVIKAVAQAYPPGTHPSDTLLRLREQRKEILHRAQPPHVRAVIDEAAIRRTSGGRKVMVEQLKHLIDLSEWDSLTIQVLPLDTGAHTGLDGAFDLMSFGPWTIVFREGPRHGSFIDDEDQVNVYQAKYELLQIEALSPDRSREYLQQALADL